MASAKAPPKSILKKTQPSFSSSETVSISESPTRSNSRPVPKTDKDRRALATALQHAQLLQEQKAISATNLAAIEELSEYPLLAPGLTTAAPTPASSAQASRYTSLLLSFQPTDFDALVEERHANSRCGNVLCARPPRTLDPKRKWLRPKGGENWCSDACARAALYVRAQLSETPAWERRGGGAAGGIVLAPEAEDKASARGRNGEREQAQGQDELAFERGEKPALSKVDRVVLAEVREKETLGQVVAPVAGVGSRHDEVEGYRVGQLKAAPRRAAQNLTAQDAWEGVMDLI